jgi:signal transduction histidine kinase
MNQAYYLVIIGMAVTFLLALSLVFFYIRYHRRLLNQELQLQKAELLHKEELLHGTIQSQEDERRRIGRDLHDGVGSMLSNLRMNISRLNSMVGTDPAVNAMTDQCTSLIDKTIADVRSIAHSLSPPGLELFGLAGALEELCDNINQSGKLNISIENNMRNFKKLPPNVSLALYRVLQEFMSNTVKHAGASTALIRFSEQDNSLLVHYKDDGKGFLQTPEKHTGMGMRNIESRLGMIGAKHSITSLPGEGFSAGIIVPLNSEAS